ncbi:MAG: sulfotransferase [Deltaproteobacteria bacterium]|nr:sulfotransferase [Deltaproteobacteria bacterium]MBW2421822.1 sulfotransferase [Deltaproteobacteria bacterium]
MTGTRDARAGFAESEAAFHEAASAAVGHDDFGDPSYLEALRVLLCAYDEEARFNDYGREASRHKVVETLKKRLRAEQVWKASPGLRGGEIRRPIVICGLVRTGSTALHYLMGQDPGMQCLEYWLASKPQPRPPRGEWEANPDYQASRAEIDFMYEADPSLKAIHFLMADGPEECRHLLEQGFTDDGFEVNASVPSYSRWYASADMRPTYRRHRDLVATIGSTEPEKRWLLKYPVHMRYLADFLEVYPDACIVQTHRDPSRVLSSYCSLIAGFRAIFEDDIQRKTIAEQELELWAAGAERAIEVRGRHDPRQFFDLHFHEFMEDPVGSVKRIYAHFDQELSDEGEACLRGWQNEHPQHKHGKHDYAKQDIGLSRGEILERFAAYMDHFGMEPEQSKTGDVA